MGDMMQESSLSALGNAAFRALESEEKEKICDDPYSRKFVPTWFYSIAKFTLVTGYAEHRSPGVMGALVTRSRYIDDYLTERIKDGIEQLIILGAGYDSRPYRFEQLKRRVKVFEVDNYATQNNKKDKLAKIFGALPDYVTFVPVDLTKETLENHLIDSSYNKTAKTLFIMEGLSMYLNDKTMDNILSFVTECSGAGSSIIFDYFYRSVIDGNEIWRSAVYYKEKLTYGIEKGKIEGYMEARGFRQIHEVDNKELERMYCTGKNRGRAVFPGISIVSANTRSNSV